MQAFTEFWELVIGILLVIEAWSFCVLTFHCIYYSYLATFTSYAFDQTCWRVRRSVTLNWQKK